jgi:hypothetical protein
LLGHVVVAGGNQGAVHEQHGVLAEPLALLEGELRPEVIDDAIGGRCSACRTAALKEIDLCPAWQGTGAARHIHDTLLVDRDEPYVTLMVNAAAGDGKVHALYRSWGYGDIGHSQPSPASPRLTVMIRSTG